VSVGGLCRPGRGIRVTCRLARETLEVPSVGGQSSSVTVAVSASANDRVSSFLAVSYSSRLHWGVPPGTVGVRAEVSAYKLIVFAYCYSPID
jgi:hypothetical protein